jgi:tetratricopeptide (TPR) repeat protein
MKSGKWITLLVGLTIGIISIFFTAYLKQKRRDRNQNIISDILYQENETKWVTNSFYGLIFQAPNSVLDPKNEITNLDLSGVKTGKVNEMEAGGLSYCVLFMNLESNRYDLEKGMRGILSNLVKEMKGSNLKYEFKYGESWLPYGIAEGEFVLNSEPITFKAFLSFKKDLGWHRKTSKTPKEETKSFLRSLIILGKNTDQNTLIIKRSFDSINLDSLKREKNPLMWLTEKNGQTHKSYNPSDTVKSPEQTLRLKRLSILRERYQDRKKGKQAMGGEIGYNSENSIAKELEPEDATTYYNRGNSKSRLQDFRGAIADFTKSIELNPSSDAYNNRGISKAKLQDYERAIDDFTKSIELGSGNDADAYNNRGGSKGAIEDFRGAIEDFTKAIEIKPEDPSAYYGRGIAKLKLGQNDSGCLDLFKSGELGNSLADEAKKKYCN